MQVCTRNGKTMMLGEDDDLIQTYARDNLLALEDEHNENKGIPQFFVAIREATSKATSKVLKVVTTIAPHCIIEACDMWEALEVYNRENRRKVWVPVTWETRDDRQIGVDRIENKGGTEVIRIHRMRKDQILRD